MSLCPQILVVTDYYLPGYKAGGPIRSIANMVERLGDEFQFNILTADRDLDDTNPYPHIESGVWHAVGKAQVLYLSPSEKRCCHWRRLLKHLDYDVLYLNGCFSRLTIKTLLLRKLRLIPRVPVILAPRGEFSRGALDLKKHKKALYLCLSRRVGLYNGITWQASSDYERLDIMNALKNANLRILVAPNLVSSRSVSSTPAFKGTGSLKIAFLSRVARKKNLDYALQVLANLQGDVIFHIYGLLEDADYWQECESLIARMPSNVRVEFRGEVSPDQVIEVLTGYHLFFFPTRGENFGHVIFEALRAGCPVLISDQTPWQGLEEQKAGWVVPLSQPERFQAILQAMLEMNDVAFKEWSHGARAYSEQAANTPTAIEANRTLFLTATRQNGQRTQA